MSTNDGYDATTMRGERLAFGESLVELALTVVEGIDSGARCVLSSDHDRPFLVGQSPTCDLRLRDRAVSRRHAAFDASRWPVRVTDLGSTNGTFVNDVSVVEARLTGGERLRLGDAVLVAECLPARPRARLSTQVRFGRVLGASPAMRRLYPILEGLAVSSTPVLIEGEPGSGKELLAESLHEVGPRSAGPFVVVDCMAGARALVRRQRERGDAFDALLVQAARGTILFDEVGELDATMQRALSRALAAMFASAQPGDARVLVTTRKNLDGLVQHGRFREDLYAMISASRVELPPLRARSGDLQLLARHFWDEAGGGPSGVLDEAMPHAETYGWPGNVRELAELVGKLLAPGEAAPASARAPASPTWVDGFASQLLRSDLAYSEARRRLLVAFEQEYVKRMLVAHGGNVTRAAAASGLARRNFQLIRARRREDI